MSPKAATPREAERRARRAAAREERDRQRRRAVARRKVRTAVFTIAAVALIGVIAFSFSRQTSGGVSFEGDLRAGGRIERLTLPALEGGGNRDYSDYAARPLVINFFASWCPNCIAEMPDFERVHQATGGEVAFLGVSQSDAPQASIDLAAETGITYDTAIDRQGAFFNALGATGMPTTVFVRPGGEIAQVWVGALDEASLTQLIDQYLGVAV